MASKRKRVVLIIKEKTKIIKDIESDENATKLARIHDGWLDGLKIQDPQVLKETINFVHFYLNSKFEK